MTTTYEAEVTRRFDALSRRFKHSVDDDDYRLRGLLEALGPVEGRLILDLGCGKGRFARALCRRGARVVGLDLSAAMLAEACGALRVLATARRLPFHDGVFDAVIAVEMWEHLESRAQATVLEEARRVIKPGGLLAVVDKNAGALSADRPWLPSAWVKRIDEHRGLWMYPAGGPVRERWFWPSRMKRDLSRFFASVRIVRLLSPAEERSWLFRRVPFLRLMTLWLARCPGGSHV